MNIELLVATLVMGGAVAWGIIVGIGLLLELSKKLSGWIEIRPPAKKSNKAQRALQNGCIYEGLSLYEKSGSYEEIKIYIQRDLPLPGAEKTKYHGDFISKIPVDVGFLYAFIEERMPAVSKKHEETTARYMEQRYSGPGSEYERSQREEVQELRKEYELIRERYIFLNSLRSTLTVISAARGSGFPLKLHPEEEKRIEALICEVKASGKDIPISFLEIRSLLIMSIDQLFALRASTTNPSNKYVPQGIAKLIQQEAESALDALWRTCDRLAAVAVQKVDTQVLQQGLTQEVEKLSTLIKAAEEARNRLALLTLGAGNEAMDSAMIGLKAINEATRKLSEVSFL